MLKRLLHLGILSLLLIFQTASSFAGDWTKTKEKDSVSVYQKEVPGTKIVAFKGEGVINAPLSRVASVIFDVARVGEWSSSIVESRILKWIDDLTYIEYDHVKTPFIIKDRDFVTRIHVSYDKTGVMTFDFKSVEDSSAPVTKYVRGEVVQAAYTLKSIEGGNRTFLTGELQGDPKGAIPQWIVNYYQKDWPVDTIMAMRRQVRKDNIKDADFIQAIIAGKPLKQNIACPNGCMTGSR